MALAVLASLWMTWGCSSKKSPVPSPPAPVKDSKKSRPSESYEEDYVEDDSVPLRKRNLPLSGTKWQWEEEFKTDGDDGANPSSNYRLEFKQNGWFDFKADCRRGTGIYEAQGERISLAVIRSNHQICPAGSRVEEFTSGLESARYFRLFEEKLYFELKREAKTLIFVPAP